MDQRICRSECPRPFYKDLTSNTCVKECKNGFYAYEADFSCQSVCPVDFYGDEISHRCVKVCPAGFFAYAGTAMCVRACPDKFFSQQTEDRGGICWQHCQSLTVKLFADATTNSCVRMCPEGFFGNKLTYTCDTSCPAEFLTNRP